MARRVRTHGGRRQSPPPGVDARTGPTRNPPSHVRWASLVHIEKGLVADCYVAGNDPLHAWAFDRILWLDLEDLRVPVAPVEYVIVRKLSYYAQSGSTRHLEDVARIRRIQGEAIDSHSLEDWIGRLGVRDAWARAVALDLERD